MMSDSSRAVAAGQQGLRRPHAGIEDLPGEAGSFGGIIDAAQGSPAGEMDPLLGEDEIHRYVPILGVDRFHAAHFAGEAERMLSANLIAGP